MSNTEDNLTFWDHLDELRSTLMRIIGVTALFGIVAFCFKDWLFEVVLAPTESDFVTYRLLDRLGVMFGSEPKEFSLSLINTALAQQFLTHMKTAFSAGLLCAVPYILYALLAFVAPALYDHERRYVSVLVICGYVMFMVGVLLSYFLIFPFTFRFLSTYQVSADVVNMISLDSYMSAFMGMIFMIGLIFEMPILCWMLAKLQILNAEFMRKYRRHAIVLILIVAAIITPTSDVFTLSLVSLPMYLLYELSIGVVSRVNKSIKAD